MSSTIQKIRYDDRDHTISINGQTPFKIYDAVMVHDALRVPVLKLEIPLPWGVEISEVSR